MVLEPIVVQVDLTDGNISDFLLFNCSGGHFWGWSDREQVFLGGVYRLDATLAQDLSHGLRHTFANKVTNAVEYLVFNHTENGLCKSTRLLALLEEAPICHSMDVVCLGLVLRVLHHFSHFEEVSLLLRRLEEILVHGLVNLSVELLNWLDDATRGVILA